MMQVTDIFDQALHQINWDDHNNLEQLESKLYRFKLAWLQKDRNHIQMLSSQYTGVYKAVFSQIDMDNFFKIFNLNGKVLRTGIIKLPEIKKTWNVVTNPMYQLCVYLMHKYTVTKYKYLERVLILLYELTSYAMLTSILYQFYKREQTIAEAKAVFEKLNYKFLLKKLGSWDSVIKYKAKTVMEGGRFYEAIVRLNTLNSIDIISGIQTSYKSLIINIASLSHGGITGTIDTSTTVVNTMDGETDIKVIENASNYTNYIKSIVGIKNDFINRPLVSIVAKRLKNVEDVHLIESLSLVSIDYEKPKKDDKLIDDIMTFSMEYLNSRNITKYTDLAYIQSLKGFWSFGNVKTKPVKDKIKEYVYNATGKKTEWVLNGLVIAVLIYIFSRAIIKK